MAEDESQEIQIELPKLSGNTLKIAGGVGAAVIALVIITFGAYQYSKNRVSTVVLPGGTTYLGPSISPQPTVALPPSKFTADQSVKWVIHKGQSNPYTFEYPETLKIVLFPKDVTDSVAFSWANVPPQNNILFRIANIPEMEPQMKEYVNKPKIEYVNNWYKQYGGLKGVESVTIFTNSKGMKGYRAKYLNHSNQAPNDDVFFEIPGKPNLMIRFGNGPLDGAVFDRILDTFYWGKTSSGSAVIKPTTPPVQ